MTSPSPIDPLLVAAFGDTVVGYDKRTGATLWKHQVQAKKPSYGRPRPRPLRAVVRAGRVLVLAGCGRPSWSYVELTALDAATGAVIWKQEVDRRASSLVANLAIDDQLAIVFHHDALVAFSVQTGQVVWQRLSEHGDGGLFLAELQLADSNTTWLPLS